VQDKRERRNAGAPFFVSDRVVQVSSLQTAARARFGERNFKYLLTGPAIFVLLLVGIFPLVYLILVSFQGITMTETSNEFIGFANYARLFEDTRLWQALLHTVVFTAIALPIELLLGLAMAQLFLDQIPGRRVFIALLVLPVVVSPIVSGATWSLLFNHRFGPINQIIGWFSGDEAAILWTINPVLVYPAILAAEIWQWTPFMFLLLLAALANVDKSQLEAAQIDGAGWWRTFFRIVLPAIWPVMAVAILIRGLDLFRLFDIVWALTKGGPGTMTETISIFTYVKGFQQFETSYTAAVALLVIVLLSVVVMWALRKVQLAR
jgi:multiple sugar transport system permease protein